MTHDTFTLDGIDPELLRIAGMQPVVDYADPAAVRATLAKAMRFGKALRAGRVDGSLEVTDRAIPARAGSPEIPVRIYAAPDRPRPAPALVFFHGGAFTAGDLDTEDLRCRQIARRTGIVVVSADYRLAPEHPFPAGFEDCYDTFAWVAENAAELDVDRARLTVGGSSAGGALAASVAQCARDLGGPEPVFQMLLYPVVDNRMQTPSIARFVATPGWNQPNSVHMWRHYLGPDHAAERLPYAVPGRAEDLTGLAPAYVMTAEFDPLRDEGIAYARALMAAGVPTELHNFAGTFHGFDAAAPESGPGRRSLTEQCEVLARATGVSVTG